MMLPRCCAELNVTPLSKTLITGVNYEHKSWPGTADS